MSNKNEKSPYVNRSISEVVTAEAGHYYLQIGTEIFESDTGKLTFSRERAEKFFDSILEGLIDMKKNGTRQEKEDARAVLFNFKIHPLRIH